MTLLVLFAGENTAIIISPDTLVGDVILTNNLVGDVILTDNLVGEA